MDTQLVVRASLPTILLTAWLAYPNLSQIFVRFGVVYTRLHSRDEDYVRQTVTRYITSSCGQNNSTALIYEDEDEDTVGTRGTSSSFLCQVIDVALRDESLTIAFFELARLCHSHGTEVCNPSSWHWHVDTIADKDVCLKNYTSIYPLAGAKGHY
jgi:hypothetical protein